MSRSKRLSLPCSNALPLGQRGGGQLLDRFAATHRERLALADAVEPLIERSDGAVDTGSLARRSRSEPPSSGTLPMMKPRVSSPAMAAGLTSK